jgi:Plant transposon protein
MPVRRPDYDTSDTYWASAGPRILSYTRLAHRNNCASWSWDKCPVADQGKYRGRDKKPNVRMEIICDDKLRIWHLFFGVPGSRNDINIMNMSPLFQLIRAGKWPPGKPQRQVSWLFVDWFYFLGDSIYPRFRIFATIFGNPRTPRDRLL